MKIKRKYCRLHGWAPHMSVAGVVKLLRVKRDTAVYGYAYQCCRCAGVPGLTRTEKVKAFLRGFKLPRSVRARDFVGDRFSK